MAKHIVFNCPHPNISGGVKVILTLANLLASSFKVTVAFKHMETKPRLGWLFDDPREIKFNAVQVEATHNYRDAVCIIDYMDGDVKFKGTVPHILFMQGHNPVMKEYHNLSHPYAAIVATSKWLATIAFDRGHRNVFTIPPGIDTRLFKVEHKKVGGDKVTVGTLYHNFQLKNSKSFLTTVDRLYRLDLLYKNIQMQILTAHMPNFKGEQLKLPCKFCQDVPASRLPEFYAGCDLWVSPSLREGFGLTTMEAMASGVPTIWVRSGGLDEFLIDGHNCLILEKNAMDFDLALRRLIGDSTYAQQLAVEGKKTAEIFSWGKCSESFVKVVQGVVGA